MKYIRVLVWAVMAGALLGGAGCTVVRDQQTVGAYVDDAGITTAVKARFADDKTVSAMAISVETFNKVVQLSGIAKSEKEKMRAEEIARQTRHVQGVRNNIVVQP